MSEPAAVPVIGEIWVNDSDGSEWDITSVNEENQTLRVRPSGLLKGREITVELLAFTALYSPKGKPKAKRAELKRGDIARLRSGGPLLTVVEGVLNGKPTQSIGVLYFSEFGNAQELRKIEVPADLLDLVVLEGG